VQDAVHICRIEKSLVTPGDYGYPLLTLWVFAPKDVLNYLGFQSFDVPDEGYSSNAW